MQPTGEPPSHGGGQEDDEQSLDISSSFGERNSASSTGSSSNPFKQALKVFKGSSKTKESIGSQSSTFFGKGKTKVPGSIKSMRGDQMPWYTSPHSPDVV